MACEKTMKLKHSAVRWVSSPRQSSIFTKLVTSNQVKCAWSFFSVVCTKNFSKQKDKFRAFISNSVFVINSKSEAGGIPAVLRLKGKWLEVLELKRWNVFGSFGKYLKFSKKYLFIFLKALHVKYVDYDLKVNLVGNLLLGDEVLSRRNKFESCHLVSSCFSEKKRFPEYQLLGVERGL